MTPEEYRAIWNHEMADLLVQMTLKLAKRVDPIPVQRSTLAQLITKLHEEVEELEEAVLVDDAPTEHILDECADVANCALLIYRAALGRPDA